MEREERKKLRLWLKRKLGERGRGAKASLADYIGTDRTAITRMLSPSKAQGYRVITADELIKMAEFFGEMPPGLRQEDFAPPRHEITALYEQFSPEQQKIIRSLLKSLAPAKGKK